MLLSPKAKIPLGTHHDCERYFSKVAVNPFQAPSFFTTADYADDSDKIRGATEQDTASVIPLIPSMPSALSAVRLQLYDY